MFMKVDCLQLEVNPLAETPEGLVYTADAKLGFDDNAKFVHARFDPTILDLSMHVKGVNQFQMPR